MRIERPTEGSAAGATVRQDTVLELLDVNVSLGPAAQVEALRNITLAIEAGERVALVGPNGCGKSTLLRTLHGLLPIASGQRRVPLASRIAMLFQRPHMLRMSVRRNLQLGLWLSGVPWVQTRGRAQQALVRVDLVHLADRNGRALSGGQQQRVALARAWALQPDVWLLDEPTASLDPHAKRDVEALIADFGDELPAPGRRPPTLVLASHNLGQVKRLASRVIYLEQGRVLADLPVHDFFNQDLLEQRSPQASAFVKGETT
ncbi:phosphate ABC transporter ATP-binding protein [Hydrogenophaga aromaticivorans]|uniref:ABC transporter ATP-binding protein n=1 Tax=Hydrogenophaga aromaticivorans TaxID=2610898 RepID=UPI001B387742|nr:phosphate ABC transporter ATP-binding protein [Hydrogenophaga aromaticivorans]MBQ0918488.1 phosphate ABC transporter ATP-binding protein [Hydrogenophaga aromaticivorans]